MTKAQCYYEILGISETATSDEVKKAYRNLALVWHPDKNQSNPDAHAKFQIILKAYETLSDSREREWYDRHKDQILSDGNKEDEKNCINLFQYFSSSCYANFDDSEDGFYTVYRGVFEKLSEEEEKACKLAAKLSANKNKQSKTIDSSIDFPTFGDSNSSYEDVVRPFYAFWTGFCTNLTFDYLDKYNTLEAENRRILRAMEKENKKLKEAARKERNINVRNLVEFVKKRDKRLKAHKLIVEQQNELNRKKTAEKQRQQREKLQKQSAEYKPTAWEDMDDIEEQLRQLESEYDRQETRKGGGINRRFEESSDDDETCDNDESSATQTGNGEELGDEESEDEEPDFFCPACSKDFKSIKAFENHEASKKHKQNVIKLTKLLQQEEAQLSK